VPQRRVELPAVGRTVPVPQVDGAAQVRLPTTKTVIASQLGVTKETFSRLLRELAQLGLITVARREIALLDRDRLAEIARNGPQPR